MAKGYVYPAAPSPRPAPPVNRPLVDQGREGPPNRVGAGGDTPKGGKPPAVPTRRTINGH